MEALAIAAVILLAVLVGLAVPVLLQLRSTLRSAQRLIDETTPRVDEALREITKLTLRANGLAAEAELAMPRLRRLSESAERLAATFEGLRGSLGVVSGVAPAAFAAVRAAVSSFVSSRSARGESEELREAGESRHASTRAGRPAETT